MRAIYVNAWAFGGRRFYDLVQLADRTEINAFVIDVKDDTGYLTYRSDVPTAVAIGANDQLRARDVRERLRVLREHGIHPIARIVVAKDPLLASRKPGWSVQHVNGGLWRDRLDFAWVDAFNDSVWVYAAQLAAEAVRVGLRGSAVRLRAVPGRAGEPAGVRRLPGPPRRARPSGRASPATCGCCASAPGRSACRSPSTCSASPPAPRGDMGIGQLWEDLVTTADVVLPMVYPSHYARGYYNLAAPEQRAVQGDPPRDAGRLQALRAAGQDRRDPALSPGVHPGRSRTTRPSEVREQIRAAEELGIDSWVLWNPRSAYDPGIFRPRDAARERGLDDRAQSSPRGRISQAIRTGCTAGMELDYVTGGSI